MPEGQEGPSIPQSKIIKDNSNMERPKPDTLYVAKGRHAEVRRVGEEKEEKKLPNYKPISDELRKLAMSDKPDLDRRDEIKRLQMDVVRDAKDNKTFDYLQGLLLEAQTGADYKTAREAIENINLNTVRDIVKSQGRWKEEYEGVLEDYRDVAVINMEIAHEQALLDQGLIDPNWRDQRERKIERLSKEKNFLGWGIPPLSLESNAKKDISEHKDEYLKDENKNFFRKLPELLVLKRDAKTRQEKRLLNRELRRLFDEAQERGILSRLQEEIRGELREVGIRRGYDYDAAMEEVSKILIDRYQNQAKNSSNIWDDRFDELLPVYLGLTHTYMEYAKLKYKDPESGSREYRRMKHLENLLNDEKWFTPMEVIDIKAQEEARKEVHTQQQTQQQSPSTLTAKDIGRETAEAIGAPTPEKQRKNFLEIERSGQGEVQIPPLDHNTWEGLNTQERAFWQARLQLSNGRAKKQATFNVTEFYPNPAMMQLTKEDLDSLTNHKGVAEAYAAYKALFGDYTTLRDGKRYYATLERTRGVTRITAKHPLEGDQANLELFRRQFQRFLQNRMRLSESEALDAEQVGYNILYMTNYLEEKFKGGGLKNFADFKTAELMFMRAKIIENVTKEGGKAKAWPPGTILGEWAFDNRNRIAGNPDMIPMPEKLFQSFDTEGVLENNPLVDLEEKGRQFVNGRLSSVGNLDWSQVEENPFNNPYYIGKVNPAQVIYTVFFTGGLSETGSPSNFVDVYNHMLNLGVDKKKAKQTIEAMFNILQNKEQNWLNAKSRNFRPIMNPFYKHGYKNWLKQNYPSVYNIIYG